MPHPVIDVRDVTRSLSLGDTPVPILHGITFSVEAGEWVAVTGPSGSGKSTLLGIVAGLDAPTSGTVEIDGVEVSSRSESQLARIRNEKVGVVFQSFNLIPTLTAQENVEAPLYVSPHRRQAKSRARAMLERVGLGDRLGHRPHQLSGGQQQRVAIARALVTEPALVVADEPTGNLDAATSAAVLDLFADLRRDLGLTLFVVTHDPDVAARADRVIELVDGLIATDLQQVAA
ncbi:ABC transporter ATP-binding protein [Rubrivirga sp.]|uniref:ABC transporter ATP-binding protein n=1 Tax=Rubrivirga sp. TaxID=1885344 RepID=UPI003C72816E